MTYDLPDTILRVDRLPVMTLLLESSYFPCEYTELVILSGEPPLILGFFSPVDITIVLGSQRLIGSWDTVPVANITIGLPGGNLGDDHGRSLVLVAIGHMCPLVLYWR